MAVTLLSIGGTVAMASASPSHANTNLAAATAAAHVPATDAAPSTSEPPTTAAPSTTVPPTTVPPSTVPVTSVPATTVPVTRPAAPPPTAPRPVPATVQAQSVPPATSAPGADTCAAALAYLSAHSAPGFQFQCPGYALGHQAMTCIDEPGACPGIKLIAIAVVCPASYMNEAHNSWILSGLATGTIDPYGYCH